MFQDGVRRQGRRVVSQKGTLLVASAVRSRNNLCETLETRLYLSAANYQNPTWFRPCQLYAVGSDPIEVQVADLGNGHPDIVALNAGSSTFSVLLGNGNGTFQSQMTFPAGSGATAFAIADVNHDGKPDLIVADYDGVAGDDGTISVLLGNGNGTFGSPEDTVSAGPDPVSIAVADINNDGNPDVIVANSGTNPDGSAVNTISILLGNGNGSFQPAYTVATDVAPTFVTTADLNRDGNVDLIVGGMLLNNSDNNVPVQVLLGSGNGSFQPGQLLSGDDSYDCQVSSIAVADLNGDGIPDLIIGEQDLVDGLPRILTSIGNGDGTFQTTNELFGVEGGDFVAAADLTGNGQTDVIGLDTEEADFQVCVNLGHGDLSPLLGLPEQISSSLSLGNSRPVSLTAADLNGDGKPDIITADGSLNNTVGVFLNSTVTPSLVPRVGSTTLGATEIDGSFTSGSVSVSLVNDSSRTWVAGVAGITVFACTNGTIDADQAQLASVSTISLNIGPGRSMTAQLPVRGTSTSQLALGNDTLLAEVIDPYDNTINGTFGPKLKVAPLAPIIPPPNSSDTLEEVIGSAHGVTVPIVWYTPGLGVGPPEYRSEVLLTGGTASVYSNANGDFDMEMKGNCSLTISSAVPADAVAPDEVPDLDLGTVDVNGNLMLLDAPQSNLDGQFHVTGSIGTAILQNITGSLLVDGSIGNLRTRDVSGDISAGGHIGTLYLAQVSGTIAAQTSLDDLSATSLTSAKVIAGATISDTGALIDPEPAIIGAIRISGAVSQSFIGAGVDPQDGIYGNGNDTAFPTGPSELSYFAAESVDATSIFEAAEFRTVRIDKELIAIGSDPRFRTLVSEG